MYHPRKIQRFTRTSPPLHLQCEMDFPIVPAHGIKIGIVIEVKNRVSLTRPGARKQIGLVISIEVHLERFISRCVTLPQFFVDILDARRRDQCWKPVLMGKYVIDDDTGLNHSGPSDEGWHTETTLPGRPFFATERFCAAVGVGASLGAIVSAVNDNSVVLYTQRLQLVQQLTDLMIVLH